MIIPNQFVHVRSGEIIIAGSIDETTGRFWTERETRANGKPDRRRPGHLCQIRASEYGYFVGDHAPVDTDREARAEPLRRRILELRKLANQLECELQSLYAWEE